MMEFLCLNRCPTGEDEYARTDCVAAEGTESGDAEKCITCGKFVSACQWLPPYRVELETWGNEYGDLVFGSGIADDFLVSDRFRILFEQSGLHGLSDFSPVEVISEKQHGSVAGERPQYFRAVVCRSTTTIDQAASGFQWIEPPGCQECFIGEILKRWERVVVDESTWAGEDIFYPRGMLGEIVVTSRFADWCIANQLRNAVLVASLKSSHDFYPWETTADQR